MNKTNRRRAALSVAAALLSFLRLGAAEPSPKVTAPASALADPAFFPLAVWLQSPSKAEQFKKVGINTYVALWKGPTEEQLAELKATGVKLICHQNEVGLRHLADPTILAWMHGDEPDNAQSKPEGKGYGPPILPEKIVQDYRKIKAADPSRPVLLNLGQGVAWDNYIGRGSRRNHPEDYAEYIQGCDIASFDIYPVVHDSPEVAGNLAFVGRGVERLRRWGGGEKTVWNCLECTHIGNPDKKAGPRHVRAEAWMSIIHGSRGLIYFVHQFKPVFREAALLDDPEMVAAIADLNRQITALAPVLNSPDLKGAVRAESGNPDVPVAVMAKRHLNTTYIFAIGMRDAATTVTFTPSSPSAGPRVNVLGEGRRIESANGKFADSFEPWTPHIYEIPDNAK